MKKTVKSGAFDEKTPTDDIRVMNQRNEPGESFFQICRKNRSPLKCMHCHKLCPDQRHLLEHIARRHKIRQAFKLKHSCRLCGENFAHRVELKTHMKKLHRI